MGARTLMMTAPAKPKAAIATPVIIAETLDAWESQRSKVFRTLEREIYGKLPLNNNVEIIDRRRIDSGEIKANAEEITLKSIKPITENSVVPLDGVTFKAVVIAPEDVRDALPVIMMENFCPNHNVIPFVGISKPVGDYFSCDKTGFLSNLVRFFFGRYITTPPIEMILDRGYALAVIFPSTTFPDKASAVGLYEYAPDKSERWGAIGAWAWQFSLLSNYLDGDNRFSHTIAYGHSRYGKSALMAAAYDRSIDSVIAHQSGTGGASLSKDKPGETVSMITAQYPHWFTPAFNVDNLTVDQHHMLAMIAPRPILLGNAKRDVWSDPEGAFRAAQGATPIYNLYGSSGLEQKKLNEFIPNADIAFWMRRGTHGVVKEDWPAFLDFLDAHFTQ